MPLDALADEEIPKQFFAEFSWTSVSQCSVENETGFQNDLKVKRQRFDRISDQSAVAVEQPGEAVEQVGAGLVQNGKIGLISQTWFFENSY